MNWLLCWWLNLDENERVLWCMGLFEKIKNCYSTLTMILLAFVKIHILFSIENVIMTHIKSFVLMILKYNLCYVVVSYVFHSIPHIVCGKFGVRHKFIITLTCHKCPLLNSTNIICWPTMQHFHQDEICSAPIASFISSCLQWTENTICFLMYSQVVSEFKWSKGSPSVTAHLYHCAESISKPSL